MNKTTLVTVLFVIVLAALIGWSTFRGPRYRVQVCMNFNSRTACRNVSAKSEEAAVKSGVENACADLVSGVTETINCGQTEPQSIEWLSRP